MERIMGRRNKFAREWGNQTDIGRHFGMSAIALGKYLTAKGLRDPLTKTATEKALAEGYAKSTPLRDGTPFAMWNRAKIGSLLTQSGKQQVPPLDYHSKRVFDELREYLRPTDDGKLDSLIWQCLDETFKDLLEDAPAKIRVQVRSMVIKRLEDEKVISAGDIA
jgi:hypothetical protein